MVVLHVNHVLNSLIKTYYFKTYHTHQAVIKVDVVVRVDVSVRAANAITMVDVSVRVDVNIKEASYVAWCRKKSYS